MTPALLLLFLLSLPASAALSPSILEGWNKYIRTIEPRIERQNQSKDGFLWLDQDPKRRERVRKGEIVVESTETPEVPDAMIHHWTGAVFIPGVTLQQVTNVDRDYARHKILYKPEVMDSRILEHNGNHYRIYLRLYKHKVLTAVLDTEHSVDYRPIGDKRMFSRSVSTSVREVKDPGEPDQQILPPGEGVGFLWAINSYWRLEERDGGVYAECEAVSLTRDLPMGTGRVFGPVIRTLASESLTKTLEAKRKAMETAR